MPTRACPSFLCGVLLLSRAALAAGQNPPPQTPLPSGVIEAVTVTATEAKAIAAAVHAFRADDDPLVETVVADNILALANALGAEGHTYQIGPATPQEGTTIDLAAALASHAVDGGRIHLAVRTSTSAPGSTVHALSRMSFIAMCADLASGAWGEPRVLRKIRMIFVARMILDLGNQTEQAIAERDVLRGLLHGFGDVDHGKISGRVLEIGDAMAAGGLVYDLVPANQLQRFGAHAEMDQSAMFVKVVAPRPGWVNVSYAGATYAATLEHFVWFFVRFLLEDEKHQGWDIGDRIDLGKKLLDYLAAQLHLSK